MIENTDNEKVAEVERFKKYTMNKLDRIEQHTELRWVVGLEDFFDKEADTPFKKIGVILGMKTMGEMPIALETALYQNVLRDFEEFQNK